MSTVPHFNALTNRLRDPELTPVLMRLIATSAKPFGAVKDTFAIDSSGFTSCRISRDRREARTPAENAQLDQGPRRCRHEDQRGDRHRRNRGQRGRYQLLRRPVEATAANFREREISADKAYSSRRTLALVEEMGGLAYIPFKTNTVDPGYEDSAWARRYHEFALQRAAFEEHYHRRSNAEATFAMIKQKFGETLLSKSEHGQVNELLCKVLAHNLCCVVSAIHELGIEPSFQ